MRNFAVLLLLILLCFTAKSQDTTKPFVFEEINNIENVNAKELHVRANIWFSEKFNSAKDIIQLNSADEGIIIAKPIFQYRTSISSVASAINGPVSYTIKISVKDGKYKCVISDFYHKADFSVSVKTLSYGTITNQKNSPVDIPYRSSSFEDKLWNDLQFKVESYARQLLELLATGMKKDQKESNW